MTVIFRSLLKKRVLFLLGVAVIVTAGFFHTSMCSPVLAACIQQTESTQTEASTAQIAPRYFKYSDQALHAAQTSGEKVVLYFWAPWCSSCTALDVEIEKDPELIPHNVIVLRINYDSASELKKKYAITIQHTFVQIDHGGQELAKWVGGEPGDLQTKLK